MPAMLFSVRERERGWGGVGGSMGNRWVGSVFFFSLSQPACPAASGVLDLL